jgi:hypothetical protein
MALSATPENQLAYSPSRAFHHITAGDNTPTAIVCGGFPCSASYKKSVGYSAGIGYDLVTGLGSPDAFLASSHAGTESGTR